MKQLILIANIFLMFAFFLGVSAKAEVQSSSLNTSSTASLLFLDRIKCQEAIERIYYKHRTWPKDNPQPKPVFESAASMNNIRDKVEDS